MTIDKTRLGQCYKLAGKQIAFCWSELGDEPALVHGTVNGNPHAWVEYRGKPLMHNGYQVLDGITVWDPVLDLAMPRIVYERICLATEERRYTREEVMENLIKTTHWGPWK